MRGRFAPSPTGGLHLGNARTALLAWLHARASGGAFVLRVEDLDASRVRSGIMEAQLDELRWLGLEWDEGPDLGGPYAPYVQSERRERYGAALDRLAAKGLLYPCFCSRREIASAASAPNGPSDEGPRYPGSCAEGGRTGTAAALRFRVRRGEVLVDDLLQGRSVFSPERETGDFVVRRRDGVASYQLAVVVDDALMGISHVVRGADLLSSTARQRLLYEALDLPEPSWVHVPLVLGPDGERLSKRHGSIALSQIRQRGIRASEVVGWLAATCGLLVPGETCTPEELIPRFDLALLPSEPTRLHAREIARLLG